MLRKDHAGNIVIEYRVVPVIDVEIFHLHRPDLIEHRLYADAGGPPDNRFRARTEHTAGGSVTLLAVQPAYREAAGEVRQHVVQGDAGARPESRERLEVRKAAGDRAAAVAGERIGADGVTFDPRAGAIGLEAEHDTTELRIVSESAADQGAVGLIVVAGERPGIGLDGVAPAAAALNADIEAGPIVDDKGWFLGCRRFDRHVGRDRRRCCEHT